MPGRAARLPIGVLCATLAMTVSTTAYADLSRQSNAIVGERPLGFGGAFTGLADSPAASYYNPAGLASLYRRSASASLSLQVVERLRIDNAYLTSAGPADFVSDGTPVLPIFSSVVTKFGRARRDGIRPFAFAFSTLQPNTSSWRAVIDRRLDSPAIQDSLVIEEEDRQVWYGGSFAYRINPRISIGLTAFLTTRNIRHSESVTQIEEGVPNPERGTLENPYFGITETLAEVLSWHTIFRVGVLWQPTPRWQIGLMVQPPGIQVRGEGRIRERTSYADLLADPGYATFYLSDQGDLPVDTPAPWQLRLGAATRVAETISMTADVEVIGPAGSATSPIQLIDERALEVESGRTPRSGYFFPRAYTTDLIVNAAVGFEWFIRPTLPLRFGAFTGFAATSAIPDQPTSYLPPRIDSFGGTLAMGYKTGDYDFTLGASGQYGTGDAVAYGSMATGDSYAPTTASAWSLHIFIGGYRRAASTLARSTLERIRARRRGQADEPTVNAEAPPASESTPSTEPGTH